MTDTQFSITPVDSRGLTNLANGLDGFEDDTTALRAMELTTLFVTAPTAESNGRCMYFLTDDGSKAFVPNHIVGVWITDLSVRTISYNDSMLEPQEKLLLQFCTKSGEYWTVRTGLTSWASSSVLLGLLQLNTAQLSEPLSITVSNKGRACFLNVRISDGNGGWKRVDIPREDLHKLEYDEALDAITQINQTAQAIETPALSEPVAEPFVAEDPSDETPCDELDELIDEVRAIDLPTRKRRSSAQSTDAVCV